jgi:hypothetical protein
LSFFSRLALVLLLVLTARPAFALNVLGVYRAACDRVMGVVVRVERRDVHLLTLSGELVTIPRHEIVSLTYYPVPSLPISNITLGTTFPVYRVKALQGKQIVDLVEGWPIDYSEEKISFLQRATRRSRNTATISFSTPCPRSTGTRPRWGFGCPWDRATAPMTGATT